jgi:hypothetical protein
MWMRKALRQEVVQEVSHLLQAYLDEPSEDRLYFSQTGLPGRNVAVEKGAEGSCLVVGRGFSRSLIAGELPTDEAGLQGMGFGDTNGIYRKAVSAEPSMLGQEIVEVLSLAWGECDLQEVGVLTDCLRVAAACRNYGHLAFAVPGVLGECTKIVPRPVSEDLAIVLSLNYYSRGDYFEGGWAYLPCPPTVTPDNLEFYLAMTFGNTSSTGWRTLAHGGFYHCGWGYSGSPELGTVLPLANSWGNDVVVTPGYYDASTGKWRWLLLHPDIQLYSYPGSAEPIYSDNISYLPPIVDSEGKLYASPARDVSFGPQWKKFLNSHLYGAPTHERRVEEYSLAHQAPELLTW